MIFLSLVIIIIALATTRVNCRQHLLDKNVKFGYQNPIRVAPTLAPNNGNWNQIWNPYLPGNQPTINGHNNHPTSSARATTHKTTHILNNPRRCLGNSDSKNVSTNGKVFQYRLDRKTQKCYQLGSREPCGGEHRNMAFYAVPNENIHGECDCIQGYRRPLVYHPQTNTCYYIYQQAYCSESQWLFFDDQKKPICDPNPCRDFAKVELKWDWTRNSNTLYMNTRGIAPVISQMECVALGARCKPDGTFLYPDSTNENTMIALPKFVFRKGDLIPGCHRNDLDDEESLSMDCRPGSKLDVTGRC